MALSIRTRPRAHVAKALADSPDAASAESTERASSAKSSVGKIWGRLGIPAIKPIIGAKEVVPMAKKVTYRAVPIERVTGEVLAGMLAGATKLVVAIDVAKTKMMAGFGGEDGSVTRLVRFESPKETRAFVEQRVHPIPLFSAARVAKASTSDSRWGRAKRSLSTAPGGGPSSLGALLLTGALNAVPRPPPPSVVSLLAAHSLASLPEHPFGRFEAFLGSLHDGLEPLHVGS